ncbi:hypothetical protein ACFP3Q_02750 [Nocardioides sp. GCM10027113]
MLAGSAASYLVLPWRGAAPLPTAAPPAQPDEVVYASQERLFVPGHQYPISPTPQSLALTSGGLFYLSGGALYLWRDGEAVEVADLGHEQWLQTDADGRYLAFIDRHNGPMNLSRERIAQVVVVDTTTGEEIVRDGTGNGDRWEREDLPTLYAELPPTVLGFDDGHVYASTASDAYYRWDLGTGQRELVPEPSFPDVPPPATPNRPGGMVQAFDVRKGRVVLVPHPEAGSHSGGRLSPDGRHLLYTVVDGPPLVVELDSRGRALPGTRPTEFSGAVTGRFLIGGWLDDDRFLGVRWADPNGRDGRVRVVSCRVDTGSCQAESAWFPAIYEQLPVLALGQYLI